ETLSRLVRECGDAAACRDNLARFHYDVGRLQNEPWYIESPWEAVSQWLTRLSAHDGASMTDVTRILSAIEQGDPHAADQLLPLVYAELRKLAAARLAQEKPGQTLQATALVHEAYLRLVGSQNKQKWDGRGHFAADDRDQLGHGLSELAGVLSSLGRN